MDLRGPIRATEPVPLPCTPILHPWVHAQLWGGMGWADLLAEGHTTSPGSGTPGFDLVPGMEGVGEPRDTAGAVAALAGSLLPSAVLMALSPSMARARGAVPLSSAPLSCLGKGGSQGWDGRVNVLLGVSCHVHHSCCTHTAVPTTLWDSP